MKALKYKSLIFAASMLIVSGLTSESAFAQRSGRGGGGSARGGAAMSRGGGATMSRSSGATMSRGSGTVSRSSAPMSRSSSTVNRGTGTINRSSSTVNRGSGAISRSNGTISRGGSNLNRNRAISRSGQRPGVNNRIAARGGSRQIYSGRRVGARPGYARGRHIYRPGFGYHRLHYGYRSFYRPYLGFSLSILPFGYYPFYYGADQFYYAGGLFYRQYDNQYKVVVPPVGAEVPSLPDDATEVVINGQTYYEYKGVYYSEAQNADGKTVYIVAGKDGVLNTDGNVENLPEVGEIVSQLPEGSREVMLKGLKYYVSPDDVYYEEVKDGSKTTYRVVEN